MARITAIQVLRSTGIDRARSSVIQCLTDLLVRYLQILGTRSKEVAESAGRQACELEDLREALEGIGALRVTTKQNAREEEGVLQFITWCMSDETTHMRRVAGEGQDEMGEEVTADWLNHLIQKQIKVTGENKFRESVISSSLKLDDDADIADHVNTHAVHSTIDGLSAVADTVRIPEIVQEHNYR